MVVLLRGVNVGGKNVLSMAELRSIAETCDYGDVRTYIQSGNLVLSTTKKADAVSSELRRAIADATSLDPAVIVRTRKQLDTIVAKNPYLIRGEDPAHLHVSFMEGKAAIAPGDLDSYLPEEAVAIGQQVYWFLPSGVGRSRLAADLARRKGTAGTMRNWRTVTKLVEMAAETSGSA
jgi:uncharacterized protein (DUF1697 family)